MGVLRRDHPLTAPAYSEQRSTMAKQLGLGRKPKAQVAPAATRAAPVSADADPKTRAKPTRSRGTRSAAKSKAVTERQRRRPRRVSDHVLGLLSREQRPIVSGSSSVLASLEWRARRTRRRQPQPNRDALIEYRRFSGRSCGHLLPAGDRKPFSWRTFTHQARRD